MKKTVFTGAGVAIVTPMHADLSVNYDKLGELLDFQLAGGTDAIVICGTTGESSTLTNDEHVELIRYTVEHIKGRIPVVAGVGSNDTQYAIWLSKEAKEMLCAHDWPGNVRELKNLMERAMILCRGSEISPKDLVSLATSRPMVPGQAGFPEFPSLKEARDWFERAYIQRELKQQSGSVSR
ncbi:MAG: dihydrodipicolinate synthase family protein, partial [Clostridiales bacterium]|nr:dihydrodipicolinate synthase family protein [Clostridiales bacterium]